MMIWYTSIVLLTWLTSNIYTRGLWLSFAGFTQTCKCYYFGGRQVFPIDVRNHDAVQPIDDEVDAADDVEEPDDKSSINTRLERYKQGYTKGCCDIMIFNRNIKFIGMCLEFKTPVGKGVLNPFQKKWLLKMKRLNYDILVSRDFEYIILRIENYCSTLRYECSYCGLLLKSVENKQKHEDVIHFNQVYEDRMRAITNTSSSSSSTARWNWKIKI